MILTCHYLLFSGVNSRLGHYLGGTGNIIFFLLSALLYGNKYNSAAIRNVSFESSRFIKGRIIKIGSSLYPFLIIVISLFIFFDVKFSWINVGLNFAFLGFCGKLPGLGHLWFITVIMLCYTEMVIFIKLKPKIHFFSWIFLLTMIFLMSLSALFQNPIGVFIHMGFFGFLFLNANRFYEKVQNIIWWQAMLIVVFIVSYIYAIMNGLSEKNHVCYLLLTEFSGFLILALLIRYLPKNLNKRVEFLSDISLEIYLIHHFILAGPIISIVSWTNIHIVNFALLIITSVLLGYFLHLISLWFNKVITRIL